MTDDQETIQALRAENQALRAQLIRERDLTSRLQTENGLQNNLLKAVNVVLVRPKALLELLPERIEAHH